VSGFGFLLYKKITFRYTQILCSLYTYTHILYIVHILNISIYPTIFVSDLGHPFNSFFGYILIIPSTTGEGLWETFQRIKWDVDRERERSFSCSFRCLFFLAVRRVSGRRKAERL